MRFLKRTQQTPAQKRKTRRRAPRRWTPSRSVLLRTGAVLLLVGAVAAPGWWWWSGGMARSWQTALVAAEDGLDRLSLGLGLAVEEVVVEGRKRTSAKNLRRALGVGRGAPLATLDLGAARRRIEALPWVRSAALRRLLPGTVEIRIVERAPLARWQNKRKIRLIDHTGEIIPVRVATAKEYGRLPLVVGADAPAHAAALIEMLAAETALQKRVRAAVRVGARRWNLKLANGIEVQLPESNADAAWRRLAEAERKHGFLGRDVIAVDLRLGDKMVIRTRQPLGGRQKPQRRNLDEKST